MGNNCCFGAKEKSKEAAFTPLLSNYDTFDNQGQTGNSNNNLDYIDENGNNNMSNDAMYDQENANMNRNNMNRNDAQERSAEELSRVICGKAAEKMIQVSKRGNSNIPIIDSHAAESFLTDFFSNAASQNQSRMKASGFGNSAGIPSRGGLINVDRLPSSKLPRSTLGAGGPPGVAAAVAKVGNDDSWNDVKAYDGMFDYTRIHAPISLDNLVEHMVTR
jgi:hypothetical protein